MIKRYIISLFFPLCLLSCNIIIGIEFPSDEKLKLSEESRRLSRLNIEPLKILAIGNSWTENATDQLGTILEDLGYKVELSRTYLGSASLMDYANNLNTCDSILIFSTWQNGRWVKNDEKVNLMDVVEMRDWDIVTLQQRSGTACSYTTYQPHLNKLLNYIYSQDIVPLVYYHVTWSYPQKTSPQYFPADTLNTDLMYKAILSTWTNACRKTNNDNVILSAPVIQQCREIQGIDMDLFDAVDGLHLSQGKYAAACAWAATIINTYYDESVRDKNILDCSYYGPYPEDIAKEIQRISFEVVSDVEEYIELDWII